MLVLEFRLPPSQSLPAFALRVYGGHDGGQVSGAFLRC